MLKDEILPQRPDGREQSSVSWEADFRPAKEGEMVLLGWRDFKATYRGREVEDVEPLRRGDVKRVSVMMRR
jgi:Complex I intermediate-associated protein 30 (CIA30)